MASHIVSSEALWAGQTTSVTDNAVGTCGNWKCVFKTQAELAEPSGIRIRFQEIWIFLGCFFQKAIWSSQNGQNGSIITSFWISGWVGLTLWHCQIWCTDAYDALYASRILAAWTGQFWYVFSKCNLFGLPDFEVFAILCGLLQFVERRSDWYFVNFSNLHDLIPSRHLDHIQKCCCNVPGRQRLSAEKRLQSVQDVWKWVVWCWNPGGRSIEKAQRFGCFLLKICCFFKDT